MGNIIKRIIEKIFYSGIESIPSDKITYITDRTKAGVVEIHPDLKYLLDGKKYRGVRIRVDRNHYISGMAIIGERDSFKDGVWINYYISSDIKILKECSYHFIKKGFFGRRTISSHEKFIYYVNDVPNFDEYSMRSISTFLAIPPKPLWLMEIIKGVK